jgi:hypothetical protein
MPIHMNGVASGRCLDGTASVEPRRAVRHWALSAFPLKMPAPPNEETVRLNGVEHTCVCCGRYRQSSSGRPSMLYNSSSRI